MFSFFRNADISLTSERSLICVDIADKTRRSHPCLSGRTFPSVIIKRTPCGAWVFRASPARFLAECCKRRQNPGVLGVLCSVLLSSVLRVLFSA